MAPTTYGTTTNTWANTTGNELKSSNTYTRKTRDECPKILPQRQPRLRNRLDNRLQHGLGVLRHSHHRNAHPPLLARIRLHPRHSIQLLRPINRTHTPRNPRQSPSRNPPRNRTPTRLGNKKTPKPKPANRAIRRKPVRRPNLVPDQHSPLRTQFLRQAMRVYNHLPQT